MRVVGEMDIDRAEEFRARLLRAVATGGGDLVVDVSALTFCDSAGLNVLLGARAEAEEAGRRVCLAGPTLQVRRLLELTGALALFPIVPVPGSGTG
ncbi:STAS domain-containing protein [Streptomyces sp. NPDC058682]|uniref:STAS domain-containing protein n=1 Tax=Streptomyces sp. NPDC058682 TaxID=3346596 RepID=UPI00364648BA